MMLFVLRMLANNQPGSLLNPHPSTESPPRRRCCNAIWGKFILSCLWFIFTGYMTGVTNAMADNRAIALYHDDNGKPSDSYLGDIGFEFAQIFINPFNSWYNPLSDLICVYISLGSIFLFVILLIIFKLKTIHQVIAIGTNLIVLLNILFTLRFLNVTLTSFPTPYEQLLYEQCTIWPNIWLAPFLIVSGKRSACHDFFFSGHTCVVIAIALYVSKYSDVLENIGTWWYLGVEFWRLIRMIVIAYIWFIVFLTITFLLLMQLHYSIDITTAIMLTLILWKLSQYEMKYKTGFFAWWNNENYDNNEHDRVE